MQSAYDLQESMCFSVIFLILYTICVEKTMQMAMVYMKQNNYRDEN